jgi:hypothetical protein
MLLAAITSPVSASTRLVILSTSLVTIKSELCALAAMLTGHSYQDYVAKRIS